MSEYETIVIGKNENNNEKPIIHITTEMANKFVPIITFIETGYVISKEWK